MRRNRAFTLIEVLVALTIIAVALGAAIRAAGMATDAAHTVKVRQLALFVAQNRLAEYAVRPLWPTVGPREGDAEQAGLVFRWREQVSATPNPLFRRIEVEVALAGEPGRTLATLAGYAVRGQP
jgi:general secretion pathway protein I